ncbi:MAG: DUF4190 domain-containing protein [Candidatus Omnitrophica bacterium]|nr:DUF4190 domain-containing protein [Candidatus Omnitrophota bacterium]
MANKVQKSERVDPLAIISFALALLFFVPLTGLAALITGIMALLKIKKSENEVRGRGFAIAGVILGAVRVFAGLLILVILILAAPNIKQAFNEGRIEARSILSKANLRTIYSCQEAYREKHGTYINCPGNPSAIPSAEKLKWEEGVEAWDELGFIPPLKEAYYQYEVINADEDSFTAIARGDLDGDGVYSTFTINHKEALTEDSPLE